MLYDAGQMGAPWTGARAISECLWDRGYRRLDAVVLSHPDIDHYNALPELLEKFSVGAVYVSPVMFEKGKRSVAELRGEIDRHGVPVREVRAGDRLRAGDDCLVEVLHPPRNGILGSDNANSLVLAVEYRGRRIVLPGDLESPGLDDMLAEEPRQCEVLMAPHHGSRKSNSPALAAWCKPRCVVFSDDGRWNLPEINATYRAVGGQTLHTHNCGAIRVQIGEEGVKVSEFVKPL
jgi:competence protein ComEC